MDWLWTHWWQVALVAFSFWTMREAHEAREYAEAALLRATAALAKAEDAREISTDAVARVSEKIGEDRAA